MFSKRVYTKETSSVSELSNGMLTTNTTGTHPELSTAVIHNIHISLIVKVFIQLLNFTSPA